MSHARCPSAPLRFAALFLAVAGTALCLSAAASTPLGKKGHLLVRVHLGGPGDILKLRSAGFDVAGVNRSTMTASVVVTPDERPGLEAVGLPFEVERESAPLAGRGEALSDYVTPDELSAFMDQVQAAHPSLARKFVLQDSLFEGHVLYAMEITKDVTADPDRPVFLLDAQHHAREVMTPEIAKDAIAVLTGSYGTDPKVTEWVDNVAIWVVACVNPDGAAYVFTHDDMWRKNRHPNCPVDLNRNYAWSWNECGGSSDFCFDETYRGASPASEPETQAMAALMERLRPLYGLSYHSFGEYILYPYGCGDPDELAAYDEAGQTLNGLLQDDSGHTGNWATGPGWDTIYVTDGTSDDEEYGRFGAMTFTIEVNCCDFQPDYATWRDVTVQRQRAAWQFLLDRTLHGPSIQGHVTDALTGGPLEATVGLAEVAFMHGETPRQADARGRFGWVTQGNHTYHVTVSVPGYETQTREVAVATGVAPLNLALSPVGSDLIPRDPLPADGVVNQQLATTLTWSSADALSYEVYFGTALDPPMAATTTSASYAPAALALATTYHWRIVAVTASGRVGGPVWSFSTPFHTVARVRKAADPFRLIVDGTGFDADCGVLVDGAPVPQTLLKTPTRLVAKGGKALKALVPKGMAVSVAVTDPAGRTSPPYTFTW